MQTRNVAVYDWLGKRLRTYAIAIEEHEGGPTNAEFAREALKRARTEQLVPDKELDGLTATVPMKIKLWR